MENYIIIVILAALIAYGIKESAKHMRGEGGCCGGASSRPKKKKLKGKVIHTYIFEIDGMHCENCVNNVTRAINDIDGASGKVNLKKKSAIVHCDRDVSIKEIENNIEKRGYRARIKDE